MQQLQGAGERNRVRVGVEWGGGELVMSFVIQATTSQLLAGF